MDIFDKIYTVCYKCRSIIEVKQSTINEEDYAICDECNTKYYISSQQISRPEGIKYGTF